MKANSVGGSVAANFLVSQRITIRDYTVAVSARLRYHFLTGSKRGQRDAVIGLWVKEC
jgi:hypothetical protein